MPGLFLLLPRFIEISELNANCVDPDQTPRSAASDLGLHCLLMSLLWNARHKWIKGRMINIYGYRLKRTPAQNEQNMNMLIFSQGPHVVLRG